MTKTPKVSQSSLAHRFVQEMTETVEGMRRSGVMDEETFKLTMRDINRAPPCFTPALASAMDPGAVPALGGRQRRRH